MVWSRNEYKKDSASKGNKGISNYVKGHTSQNLVNFSNWELMRVDNKLIPKSQTIRRNR